MQVVPYAHHITSSETETSTIGLITSLRCSLYDWPAQNTRATVIFYPIRLLRVLIGSLFCLRPL